MRRRLEAPRAPPAEPSDARRKNASVRQRHPQGFGACWSEERRRPQPPPLSCSGASSPATTRRRRSRSRPRSSTGAAMRSSSGRGRPATRGITRARRPLTVAHCALRRTTCRRRSASVLSPCHDTSFVRRLRSDGTRSRSRRRRPPVTAWSATPSSSSAVTKRLSRLSTGWCRSSQVFPPTRASRTPVSYLGMFPAPRGRCSSPSTRPRASPTRSRGRTPSSASSSGLTAG